MSERLPSYVVHVDDVPDVEGSYDPPFDDETLSLYRELTRTGGTQRIVFSVERLLPGRRTSFTHAHSLEEEVIFVLEGVCHVRIVEPGALPREIPLRAGHAVCFPAGTGIAHTFVNQGTEECTLIVVGERNPEDRVVYPEDEEFDAHFARTKPQKHWQR